jgi:hypothetical protein
VNAPCLHCGQRDLQMKFGRSSGTADGRLKREAISGAGRSATQRPNFLMGADADSLWILSANINE